MLMLHVLHRDTVSLVGDSDILVTCFADNVLTVSGEILS